MNKKDIIIGVLLAVIAVLIILFLLRSRSVPDIIQNVETSDNNANPIADNSSPCATGYENTPESKTAFEESAVMITKIEKKCDGAYYLTVDYLSPGNDNPDDTIGFYQNTNMQLRTFKVATHFDVAMAYSDFNDFMEINSYLPTLKPYTGGFVFGRTGQLGRSGAPSVVYNMEVKNGEIIVLNEVYLP